MTDIDTPKVRQQLEGLQGVAGIHDLHIWSMSTTDTALTCHLVMPNGHPGDAFIATVAEQLRHDFGIAHATLQIERICRACGLRPILPSKPPNWRNIPISTSSIFPDNFRS